MDEARLHAGLRLHVRDEGGVRFAIAGRRSESSQDIWQLNRILPAELSFGCGIFCWGKEPASVEMFEQTVDERDDRRYTSGDDESP